MGLKLSRIIRRVWKKVGEEHILGKRRCPVCNRWMEEEHDAWRCSGCLSEAIFEEDALVFIEIPQYHQRIEELQKRELEITSEIELEGGRGPDRDMERIRQMHLERQHLLSEYSFLTYFSQFMKKDNMTTE